MYNFIEYLRAKRAQVPNWAKLSFWWILKDELSSILALPSVAEKNTLTSFYSKSFGHLCTCSLFALRYLIAHVSLFPTVNFPYWILQNDVSFLSQHISVQIQLFLLWIYINLCYIRQ